MWAVTPKSRNVEHNQVLLNTFIHTQVRVVTQLAGPRVRGDGDSPR